MRRSYFDHGNSNEYVRMRQARRSRQRAEILPYGKGIEFRVMPGHRGDRAR